MMQVRARRGYAVMNARWVRELGAYKEHLEQKLSKMCGEEILILEKLVLENVSTNSSFLHFGPFILLFL